MKKKRFFPVLSLSVLLIAAVVTRADTFFTDDFSHGSTTNQLSIPGGSPTASFTSYDFASSKNTTSSSIAPGLLSAHLTSGTTSGYWECQALFTTNPVALTAPGDYVDLTIVFTNSTGSLLTNTTSKSALWIGLYNSGGTPAALNPPVPGALANGGLNTASSSPYATGNCQLWQGYAAQIRGAASPIITRPVQDGPNTSSANQELLGNGVSGGTFNNPGGTTVGSTTLPAMMLDTTTAYTLELQIMLDPAGSGSLIISNALYGGGTLIMSNVATATTPLVSGFDGLAFGAFNSGGSTSDPHSNPRMDVSLVRVTGHSTAITNPPTITQQPVSVTVPSGAACAFQVAATGFSMSYQWHRNGTNLIDGGNISGATSPMLVISPAGPADVASGANGYYVTVTGAGGYSTNSDVVSLSLGTAKTLTWNGPGATWDLNTSSNWLDANSNPNSFNYGDAVTFNGGGPGGVTLSGNFLSASSVTVSGGSYEFSGSGSIAGPGKLIFENGFLQLVNANTYTGGTILSNGADLYLQNWNGLGSGPVTLAGGLLEIIPAGSGSSGLPGDLVVADNSTIAYNATSSSYSAVFLSDLSGTVGKTLTVQIDTLNGASPGNSMDRIRLQGNSTVYDGNLNLANPTTLWAAYGNSQTYNGVISGSGAFMQKGALSLLNGANTFAGGTLLASGAIGLGADSTGPAGAPTTSPLGTGPLLLTVDSTTGTTGTGWLFASGGPHTIGNPIQYPTGTNNLTLAIGGTNDLTFTGPFTLNGNDNVTSASITARTVQVTNTGLTTLSGVISDGGLNYGLIKTGNGTLALTAAETYTGPTLVNGGTLLVNGSLNSSSAVTVTNGLLGGTGTVGGTVTVQRGGGLAPGANGIGTLTINNALTLQGGSTNYFEVNKGAGTRDFVLVGNNVTYGGTLVVTNLSGTITTSDTFAIFGVSGSSTGNFTNLLGSPGPGLAWRFNPTNGVLSVVTGIASNPTNLAVSVSGGNINLSWPADHTGWTLQAQTNNLSAGLGTNWVDVAGSTTTNQVVIPINPTNPSVFYRLIYRP
jgi:autotransporter-associated beta strand protein